MDREKAIKYIHDMLRMLKTREASDLYLAAGAPPTMKVHGKLVQVASQKLSPAHTQTLVRSIMNDKQSSEFEASNECNFAISLPGVSRFRVNAYVQRGTSAMVVRTITDEIPDFEELFLPPVMRDIGMTKRGLVIFVGGTGSGKSTSLAAMIDYRNENSSGHIITIEDPIEFVHQHKGCIVSQREVGTDTDNWDIALKNTLRQAPDVILIGEIRDRNTMENAIAFAETGHLCLATLHANSTNQAMDRIINFFPEERRHQLLMDLSLNMKAVVSQRLLKTPDGNGRRPAVEVLLNTPLMADLILKGEIHEMKALMKKSREAGMQTFDDALFDLIEDGHITAEEGLRNADSVNDLRLKLKLESKDSKNQDLTEGADFDIEDSDADSGGGGRGGAGMLRR
ncbi:MAG: PilT/PilU family type 4a pilus ATPase [Halofilum sp. (in: g-proteobacteria)]